MPQMGQVTTTLCASRRFLPWRETIWTVVGAVAMAGLSRSLIVVYWANEDLTLMVLIACPLAAGLMAARKI
jgi:hypothetical protein